MNLFLAVLTIVAGATFTVQAGVNSQLQVQWAQSSILAAAVSFTVGTAALWIFVFAARIPIPALAGTTQWWHWIGGLFGAYIVACTAYAAPKLGAILMMALLLAGQMCSSIAVDHWGLVGYAQKTVSWPRLLGLCFVGGGVYLIRRF